MTELSQRPTMTRFSGSQSFKRLTILAMVHSFLEHALTVLATMRNTLSTKPMS